MNDRRVRLTPEQRRERAIKRKIDDRIELQMAELEERPPREDIEFGPGRDPRVYGGALRDSSLTLLAARVLPTDRWKPASMATK